MYAWRSEEYKVFPVTVINGDCEPPQGAGIYPMSSTGETSAFNHSAISSARTRIFTTIQFSRLEYIDNMPSSHLVFEEHFHHLLLKKHIAINLVTLYFCPVLAGDHFLNMN